MDQLFKINEVVCDQNRHQKEAGEPRLVRKFSKMSSVNILGALYSWFYGKKVCGLWRITHRKDPGKVEGLINRNVCGKTDLLKVSFHPCFFNYYYL